MTTFIIPGSKFSTRDKAIVNEEGKWNPTFLIPSGKYENVVRIQIQGYRGKQQSIEECTGFFITHRHIMTSFHPFFYMYMLDMFQIDRVIAIVESKEYEIPFLMEDEMEFRKKIITDVYGINEFFIPLQREPHPNREKTYQKLPPPNGRYASDLGPFDIEYMETVSTDSDILSHILGDVLILDTTNIFSSIEPFLLKKLKNKTIEIEAIGYPNIQFLTDKHMNESYGHVFVEIPLNKKKEMLFEIFGTEGQKRLAPGKAVFGNGNTFVFTDASFERGMSGGPVIMEKKEKKIVVGIITGGWLIENRNFILPIAHPFVIRYMNNKLSQINIL